MKFENSKSEINLHYDIGVLFLNTQPYNSVIIIAVYHHHLFVFSYVNHNDVCLLVNKFLYCENGCLHCTLKVGVIRYNSILENELSH